MEEFARRLVAAFGGRGIADAVVATAGRYTAAALVAVVAAVCGAASLGCAIAALWIFALPRVGPVWAALIAAGVLLALCVAGLGLAWQISARKRRKMPPPGPAPDVLTAAVARLLKEQPGTAVVAAVVAGLLAGRARPER